jgi:hypothetical protein
MVYRFAPAVEGRLCSYPHGSSFNRFEGLETIGLEAQNLSPVAVRLSGDHVLAVKQLGSAFCVRRRTLCSVPLSGGGVRDMVIMGCVCDARLEIVGHSEIKVDGTIRFATGRISGFLSWEPQFARLAEVG